MRPTHARIDLRNLAFNLRSCRDFIGTDLKYMAVVKANAYGHGAVECARVLEAEGVDWFGVALIEEAIELREAGIKKHILCLGGIFPSQESEFLSHGVTPVIFNVESARKFNEAARKDGVTPNVHIKIDTGMGRLGVRWDEIDVFISELKSLSNLHVEGLMTHFAAADDPKENAFTKTQIERFGRVVQTFDSAGFHPDIVDLANSPSAVAHPESRAQMVRLGGLLYGLSGDILPPAVPKPELRPVMSLHSAVADVKRVSRGESVGYGRTFIAERDTTIALVPIGYHDGYRRVLYNRSKVIIREQPAPVVGRISMDWTIVDVTDIPGTSIRDEVTLIGSMGKLCITAEDLARSAGTISYEITCGIGPRVPHVYINGVE